MSRKEADAGDDQKHKAISGDAKSAGKAGDSACSDEAADWGDEEDKDDEENENEDGETGCKIWLEALPSKGGLLLAVLLTEIMTEGLTASQMNILGNFISAVGSLIAYKASREELNS